MTSDLDPLDHSVAAARAALLKRQKPDGHWVFDLEADATIPAEYLLLRHFLDRIDTHAGIERKIGNYLRSIQGAHGGWPLFHDGAFDISASVKAYFALKMIGDDPAAPHMVRAREAILAAGGAARTNVFTRCQLALYGEVPWGAVPVMPVELVLLPKWFPFHLDKVSYWSRTVITPLLVLMALKPRARNPRGVHVRELFVTPPEQVTDWIRGPYRSAWGRVFKQIDRVLRAAEPLFPPGIRRRAIEWCVGFVTARLNGEDGLGAIYPAMANTVMMFDTLGYPPDHPDAAIAWQAIEKLLVIEEDRAFCQPCLSPVWDTGLAGHAVAEADSPAIPAIAAANRWLRGRQILDVAGDWKQNRPDAVPGGWAFQYENPHYPDVDDTAVVGMLLHREGDPAHAGAIARARDWIIALQSRDGGWGEDNETYAKAAHGEYHRSNPSQTAWALLGLMAAGEAAHPAVAKGVAWLSSMQKPDGEWDEEPYTAVGFPRVFYLRYHGYKLFFPLMALARYRNLSRGNETRVAWGF